MTKEERKCLILGFLVGAYMMFCGMWVLSRVLG